MQTKSKLHPGDMPLRMRMAANIPANLPDLVRGAFSRAVASGDVFFFPTHVTLIAVNSIPVCPLFPCCPRVAVEHV